jgi:tartrate dehydratase beta subunit/fumarate hydratase class I family protein
MNLTLIFVISIALTLASCVFIEKKELKKIENVEKRYYSEIKNDEEAYNFEVPKGSTLVFIDALGNQVIRRNP